MSTTLRGFGAFMVIFLTVVNNSYGQDNLQLVKSFLHNKIQDLNMLPSDIDELVITDVMKMNGLDASQVWVQQYVNDIPVYGAINSYTIKGAEVRSVGNAFAFQIDKQSLMTSTSISSNKSIWLAAANASVEMPNGYRPNTENTEKNKIRYESPDTRSGEFMVYREYYKNNRGGLDLTWRVDLSPKIGSDMWSIIVDANSGEILKKNNYTIRCSFDRRKNALGGQSTNCVDHQESEHQVLSNNEQSESLTGSYRVIEFPFESPNFADRTLVADPSDAEASPFGWHDVNGSEGAEFTNLFGNNAFTIVDRDDNGAQDTNGENPDGGAELVFDVPFDQSAEPMTNTEAAMVNAFYANNVMHDFAYHYGFDESINFQEKNYTGVGGASDGVNVRVQAGFNVGLVDNADFGTPADGINPTMRIFVGDNGAGSSFRIDSPDDIAGGINVGLFEFSPPITDVAVSGRIVTYMDNSFRPTFACDAAINGEELAGNVALIDRGVCYFEEKVVNAEAAGAIAVIICNFEPSAPGGTGVPDFENPSIPAVMVGSNDCARILAFINDGVEVSFQNTETDQPLQRDIAFDNGVLAHEYGHGLSTRSVGGPNNSSCLFNGEQAGEGWSDFFMLVTTTMPGQDGTEPRGNGTYAFGQSANGGGIRRFPYSTDPAINNQNMDDIIGSINAMREVIPHPIGEIWVGALWNMYWAFVDQFGYDADFMMGSGGNNMAIQLVFDAMKITPCGAGLLDARDAVILADEVRFDGSNTCMIWDAFAKKGMGFDADQGDSDNINDGTPGYSLPPSCVIELVVQKLVPDTSRANEGFEVSGLVINQKNETVTSVVYTDELPSGGELAAGPGNYPFSVENNSLVVEVGILEPGDSARINYTVLPDPERGTTAFYFDNIEDEDVTDEDWDIEIFEGVDAFFREEFDADAFSGDFFWVAVTTASESDYVLRNFVDHELNMDYPVLRFHHFYNTEFGFDGGFIEVAEAGTENWIPIQDEIIKNPYRGRMSYSTFSLPNLEGYWGVSGGYLDTYVDLSAWKGKTVNFRFRYGTDDNSGIGGEWRIDDVAVLNLVNANGQACVTSAEGDDACARASAIGTVIEGGVIVSVIDIEGESFEIDVHPNPASDIINISFDSPSRREVLLTVYSIDGKLINQRQVAINPGHNIETINIDHLAAGMYVAKIQVEGKEVTEKFVVE